MPHAAFYVVQRIRSESKSRALLVSMPHAAFYVVQQHKPRKGKSRKEVSMPHAAFYVVQRLPLHTYRACWSFNAARSILCGATFDIATQVEGISVSMPHAALYVVQQLIRAFQNSI